MSDSLCFTPGKCDVVHRPDLEVEQIEMLGGVVGQQFLSVAAVHKGRDPVGAILQWWSTEPTQHARDAAPTEVTWGKDISAKRLFASRHIK